MMLNRIGFVALVSVLTRAFRDSSAAAEPSGWTNISGEMVRETNSGIEVGAVTAEVGKCAKVHVDSRRKGAGMSSTAQQAFETIIEFQRDSAVEKQFQPPDILPAPR